MRLYFEVRLFAFNKNSHLEYREIVQKLIINKLHIERESITFTEEKGEQFFDIKSKICSFQGTIASEAKILEKDWLELITVYPSGSLLSINHRHYDYIHLFNAPLTSRDVNELYSISFGTILNLNSFVPHISFNLQNAQINKRLRRSVLDETEFDLKFNSLTSIFEHDMKQMLIKMHGFDLEHELVLKYSSIDSIIISKAAVKKVEEERPQHVIASPLAKISEEEIEEWLRRNNPTVNYSKSPILLRTTELPTGNVSSLIGKSNVIHLKMKLHKKRKAAIGYWHQIWTIICNVQRYSEVPIYFGKITVASKSLGDVSIPPPSNVPFSVAYAFECLNNHSFQLHDELYLTSDGSKSFIRRIENLAQENSYALTNALYDLFLVLDGCIPINSKFLLEERFIEHNSKPRIPNDNNTFYVRRCVITPSRLLLLPPNPYPNNRFMRNSEPDFVLRVNVKDDNMEMLTFSVCKPGAGKHQDTFLRNFFHEKLSSGITIGNRKYEFFGSSTSQFRDIGMVFYAKDSRGRTAHTLREAIGDLNHIRNPAKYLARIGLAFSNPIQYVSQIPPTSVEYEEDIKGGRHPETGEEYVFSDGIGKISVELAEYLTKEIAPNRKIPFSAFQIRYKGAKGMLAIDPELKGSLIVVRESMDKFESDLKSLEILKVSEPRFVYLNKQLITILEQLGINCSIFLSYEADWMKKIIGSHYCRAEAAYMIKRESPFNINFDRLQKSAIDILAEPLFLNMLRSNIHHAINMIRTKARIQVPEEFGRCMFGVLDETGALEEGQVFVQYSEIDNYRSRKVVTGEILVTKYPCLHPGDVRKFQAIDFPHLYHYCDVIVFPQHGDRPHPDEMAGSDLDGDEFAVIWHSDFIFPGENKKAMIYPSNKGKNLDRNVEVEDMLMFYCDFIQNDQVGIISNAHLAFADSLREGIFSETCINLAKQHAIALDYAKTGNNESISGINESILIRPKSYPDFMEKSDSKPTYRSKNALGKIYRLCCMFDETVHLDGILETQCSSNYKLLSYPGWEQYENDALAAHEEYCKKLIHLQKQYGIESEWALLNGSVKETQKYICDKNEKSHMREMLSVLLKNIFDELRVKFEEPFERQQVRYSRNLHHMRMAKASSWYIITQKMNKSNSLYYGLPWIVSDLLCDIADSKSKDNHVCNYCHVIPSKRKNTWRNFEELNSYFKFWFDNNLNNCADYIDSKKVISYDKLVGRFVRKVFKKRNIAGDLIENILQQMVDHYGSVKDEEEFDYIVELTALVTLFRYQRTGEIGELLRDNHREKRFETITICLSLKGHKFRQYIQNKQTQKEFFRKLKRTGIKDVTCHCKKRGRVSYLYVTASGTHQSLRALKMYLTRFDFYDEVIQTKFYYHDLIPVHSFQFN
ncbi:RNA-dependent RNA polymerase 1-like protein [Dinothrombium tinctorium]|uniref:RNA-dependent RNA polymerase n=1 Tax=Dinothrombium tinctorium TaxID=1965070 RepID=A0A443QUF4_9ACAR|nr:RNA-dependent RNA polymerase 1-like protein [Dinothrombium tinctorium]